MGQFLLLFSLTICAFLGFTWLLIFCRRRLRHSRHGLTGMCHDTGGTMCPSCRQPTENSPCTPSETSPEPPTLPSDIMTGQLEPTTPSPPSCKLDKSQTKK
jgi:hypothetical protein